MPDPPPDKTLGDVASPAAGSSSTERRAGPRYPFIATAEVTELATGAKLSARSAELGLGGCYIDTLNPFPAGTRVRLRLVTDKGTFETSGRVVYDQSVFGMGLAFTDVAPEQRAVLERWYADLKAQA